MRAVGLMSKTKAYIQLDKADISAYQINVKGIISVCRYIHVASVRASLC